MLITVEAGTEIGNCQGCNPRSESDDVMVVRIRLQGVNSGEGTGIQFRLCESCSTQFQNAHALAHAQTWPEG